MLAAGLMFSGRPRGLAASAAQQSVDKVCLVGACMSGTLAWQKGRAGWGRT